MTSKLNFGIIGCGRIAQRHAAHIGNIGTLMATCDIEEYKAKQLAEKYSAKYYLSVDDMLKAHAEMDVIVVCSPNGMHAQHSVQALKAGFHVLCEKPMALSVHDCGEMINVAEQQNRRLLIVKQNRFNPPVVAVKNILDEGRLGRIFSVQLNCFWNRNNEYYSNSWKGTKDMDGGTLFTQFSHFIDLLIWMVGDVKEATGYLANYHHQGIIEFEDTGVVSLKFFNGAVGTLNYSVNSFDKNMEGSFTLFGERGTVKIGGQYLNELEYQSIDNFQIKDLPPANTANNYGHYIGSMSNHDKVYANLVEVLKNNGVIATNGYEGLKTVEIIDKIYSSAKRVDVY
jgi:predicted dehydrogenase